MSTPGGYRVARRAFLRGCAAPGLLLPMLRGIEARAQGLKPPLRFLVLHHPLGTQLGEWRPSAPASTTSFTLPAISAPFAPLQSKMVMIDGLNIVAATARAGGSTGDRTHEGGLVALMTGQPTLGRIGREDHAAGGRSIDQIFLDESPALGGRRATTRTTFGSLQLAADVRSDRDEISPRVMSYRAPLANVADIGAARQPLYPETQPLNVYKRVFAGGLGGGAVQAQQKSVLDFVRADLARMRRLVPTRDSGKIDKYADAITRLEASLRGSSCPPPAAPPAFTQTGRGSSGTLAPVSGMSGLTGVDYHDPTDPNNHPHQRLGRLQLSMIRTAFACDLVRVATFMWSAGTNWVVFPGTFGGAVGYPSPQAHHPPSHTTSPATLAWLAQIDRWYAQQTAEFLMELDATPDIDGSSLLDNTVVVYVTEVARAWDHDWRNVPFLVFGGSNTRLAGGQFIKVTDGRLAAVEGALGGPGPNRPVNDAWLALAPVFGVDLPALGAPSQFTGPLPGLLKPA